MPKISELTDLTSLADADDTVVVDDTDDTTKRTGMDTIATYVSGSAILLNTIDTEAPNTIRQIDQDLGGTSGFQFLTDPTANQTSFVLYTLTNPDTGGGTIAVIDGGTNRYLLAIYNDSAYNIDIQPTVGFNLYLPGSGTVSSITLASNEVYFAFKNSSDIYGIYKG